MTSTRVQSRQRIGRNRKVILALGIWLMLGLAVRMVLGALAAEPANPAFDATWSRTDEPVKAGLVSRTWMWGDGANGDALTEPYAESPGGQRTVQYFDKSRMEINDPASDANSPWYVTNGLLVVELVTGQLQLGDASFEQHAPAEGNVAGDQDDPTGPDYQTMAGILNVAPLADGETITGRLDRDGAVTDDPALASYGVTAAHHIVVPGIDHQVASPFWSFMNSSGMVYENGGHLNANLFLDPFYATGYPITEAYWANVKVAGTYQDVLLQCFERRCLTYTPGNADGWQVEAGNVGQHYHAWRYEQIPADGNAPTDPTGEPPADGTATAEPSATEPPNEPDATPTATETPEQPDDDPTATQPAEEPYSYLGQWGRPVELDTPFLRAQGVDTSDDGYVYVTDALADRIVKFGPDGQFITMWGETGDGNGQFLNPTDVAVDHDGNVYVLETESLRVQKFTADGQHLLTWGNPDRVASDLPGEFDTPRGIAVDSAGYVYVTDDDNERVQKFDGNGAFVEAWEFDATGADLFNNPEGIHVDDNDVVYVGEYSDCRIQKFDTDGVYLGEIDTDTTGAGCSQWDNGIAVGPTGTVYVVDSLNDRIQAFDSSGNHVGSRGTSGTGPGEFNDPKDIAMDAQGFLYVTDSDNGRVQKLDIVGNYVGEWSDGRLGRIPDATYGMARDAGGNIYLSDSSYDRIQVFDNGGDFLRVFGEPGFAAESLTVTDDGYLYAVDNRVVKYQLDGAYVTEFGAGSLSGADGVDVDSDGNVYVANGGDDTILKFDASGNLLFTWGGTGGGAGAFDLPTDIAIYEDRVYVLDHNNHRVQVFDPDGNFLDEWGEFGDGDGEFAEPLGIGVDRDGNVFVVDTGNSRVQMFTPTGDYLTEFGSEGSGDGEFDFPSRIELSDDGTAYVLDAGNHRVQVFLQPSQAR